MKRLRMSYIFFVLGDTWLLFVVSSQPENAQMASVHVLSV